MMSSAFRTPRRVTPAYTSLNRRYSFYFGMLFIFFIAFQVYALLSLGNSPPSSSELSLSNPNSDIAPLDPQPNAKKESDIDIKPMQNKPQTDNSGTVFFRTDTISQTNDFAPPVPNAIPSPKNPIKVPSPLAHGASGFNQRKSPKPSTSPVAVSPQPSKEASLPPSPKQQSQSPVAVSPQQTIPSSQAEPSTKSESIVDGVVLTEPVSKTNSTEITDTKPENTTPTVPDDETTHAVSTEPVVAKSSTSTKASISSEASEQTTGSEAIPATSAKVDIEQVSNETTSIADSQAATREESGKSTKEELSEVESSQPTSQETIPVADLNTTQTIESEEAPINPSVSVEDVSQTEAPLATDKEFSTSTDNSTLTEEQSVSSKDEKETIEKPVQSSSSNEAVDSSGDEPRAVTTIPKPVSSNVSTSTGEEKQPEEKIENDKPSSLESPIDWTTYTLPTTADEIALQEASEWLKANNKTVQVLFWDKISGFMGNHMLRLPPKCDIPCSFSENKTDYNISQAVVFHVPQFSDFPKYTIPEQLWVAYSMESEHYYTRLLDRKFMSHFNLTMTYKLSSDIFAGYFNPNVTYYMTPPYPKNETDYGLAAFIASNCVQPRLDYVKELSKYMTVDSLGKCMRNKNFPDLNITNGGLLKFHTMKRYKFYLAFENHEAPDYVTEKFFHAIASGTVPVYWGAPNIKEFMPSNHSVISVADFETPEKLAEYLKYLDENPAEYEKYLEWKKTGPSQQFLDLISKQKLDARCRLCIRAAQQLRQVERDLPSSDVQ